MSEEYIIIDETIEKPLVSVAMLTYNHGAYLREAIDSIVKQNVNFSFELVIAEDCSPDNSRALLLEYQQKYPAIIRLVLQNKNVGIKENNASLIKNLRGKYVAICEGDDFWIDSDKLQKQIDILEGDDSLSLVYTDAIFYNQKNDSKEYKTTKQVNSIEELLVRNQLWTVTVCMRNAILQSYTNDVSHSFSHLPFADYPLWLYAISKGKFFYLNETTSCYRVLEESASHSVDSNKLARINTAVFECKIKFIKLFNIDDLKLFNIIKGVMIFSQLNLAFKTNNRKLFEEYKKDMAFIKFFNNKIYILYCFSPLSFVLFSFVYRKALKLRPIII